MSPCRRACSPSPPTPSRGPRPRPPPAWAGPWPGRPARPPPGPGGRDQPVTPALGAVMVRRWQRRWRRAGRAPTAGTRPLASRGSGGARHPVDAAATQAPGLRARRGAEGGGLGLFLFAFSVCCFFFFFFLIRVGFAAGAGRLDAAREEMAGEAALLLVAGSVGTSRFLFPGCHRLSLPAATAGLSSASSSWGPWRAHQARLCARDGHTTADTRAGPVCAPVHTVLSCCTGYLRMPASHTLECEVATSRGPWWHL